MSYSVFAIENDIFRNMSINQYGKGLLAREERVVAIFSAGLLIKKEINLPHQ